MKTFALSNLVSSTVREAEPQKEPSKPPNSVKTKDALIKWCQKPTTKACIWSFFEGINAGLRVVPDENDALYLHGFVADYDSPMEDSDLEKLPARMKFEFMPTWSCRTWRGGARLVWEFKDPLLLSSRAVTKAFLKIASKKMSLTRLLPGFDQSAFTSVETYYESGRDWQRLSSDQIPQDLLWYWMSEAGSSIKAPKEHLRIPLEVVAQEVQKRFPGRWPGAFELGARGVRFWDSTAKNPTAAVIREGGMQCFTGLRGFMSWEDIFGYAFTSEFASLNQGALLKSWWYDGKQYWNECDGEWISLAKDDFRLALKVQYNLSCTPHRKGEPTEIDEMTFKVQSQKRVEGAFPQIHSPAGLYVMSGRKFLNTATVMCLPPHDESVGEWGVQFPWLASYLDHLFVCPLQKNHFLSWFKWFYENGLKQEPQAGQALFLAGGVGVGKTLLSNCVLSPAVGGHQDAREFLIGEGSRFTDYIFNVPLLTMDDASPATNYRVHEKFSANVKRMVANEHHFYDKKFSSAGQVRWLGRVVVTCNTDQESLRILPSLEISNRDKISFFRVAETPQEFPMRRDLIRIISNELPYLCRWLVDWEYPPECLGTARFGVKAFHDPDLLENATQSDTLATFVELVDEFRLRWWLSTGESFWKGTSSQLLSILAATPSLERLTRAYGDPRMIGRNMGKLMAKGCEYVQTSRSQGATVWFIDCNPDEYPGYLKEKYDKVEKLGHD